MKKFLSFMLTLLTVLTLGVSIHANAKAGDTYTKATDVSQITDKTKVAFAGETNAVGKWDSAKKFLNTAATYDTEGKLTGDSNIVDYFLVKTTNGYVIKDEAGNYYVKEKPEQFAYTPTFGNYEIEKDANGLYLLLTGTTKYLCLNSGFGYRFYDNANNEKAYIYLSSDQSALNYYTVNLNASGEKFNEGVVTSWTKKNEEELEITLPLESDLTIASDRYLLGWRLNNNFYYPGQVIKAEKGKDVTYNAIYRDNNKEVTKPEVTSIKVALDECDKLANKAESKVEYSIVGKAIKEGKNKYLTDGVNKIQLFGRDLPAYDETMYIVTGKLQKYGKNLEVVSYNFDVYNDFVFVNTKSRLVATLDTEAQTLTNIQLALGGQISKEFYEANSSNKFGVIALSLRSVAEINYLNKLDKAGLDDLIAKNYALELTPVLDGENYNFAWSIDNIPADKYGFEFVSVMYMLDAEGNIVLANEKKTSIEATAKQYVEKADQYQFSEELLAAIKKVAKVA